MDDPKQKTRRAARVLLLDPAGCLLLFRFVDPVSARPFWITPGGGLQPGESFADAAARELYEETGIVVGGDKLGPPVWHRTVPIVYGDRRFVQHERFYRLTLTCRPIVKTSAMEAYERSDLHEHRWWTESEILASEEPFAPSRLGPLLKQLRLNPRPTESRDVGQ